MPDLRRATLTSLTAAAVVLGSVAAAPVHAADTRPVLNLTATAVQGVAMGTAGATAERQLRSKVGTPSRVTAFACSVAGERAKQLHWGTAVHVHISDIDNNSGAKKLYGWSVRSGTAKHRVVLPYGVKVGMSAAQAKSKIPGAEVTEDELTGWGITTKRAPGMVWFLNYAANGGPGPVLSVNRSPVVCD